MPAIDTNGLTRRFGSLVAVDALDLTVEDGEVFGFLGPNGAGKSTTINMLLGFLDPSEGSATVLGHDATRESRAVRQRTSLLPEGFAVYENLTGREHVRSAIQTKGADDDLDALVERVGLDPDDARRAAGGYSKGMQQRLALAIALVGDPDLLILDDPPVASTRKARSSSGKSSARRPSAARRCSFPVTYSGRSSRSVTASAS